MATIEELSSALVKADAAGNAADAKALADAIRQMRTAAPAVPSEIPGPRKAGMFDILTSPFEMGMSLAQKPRAEQAEFIAPTVEALGAAGGAMLGTSVGPLGTVTGAGAGYAGAKELMRLVGGTATPETLPQAAQRVGETALTGAAMEAGGRGIIGPVIGKVGEVVSRLRNIKADTLLQAVEGRGRDIVNALRSPQSVIVPGSAPTAGEIVAPMGVTRLPALQATVLQRPSVKAAMGTELAEQQAQTNAARLAQEARVQQEATAKMAQVKAKIDRGLTEVSPREVGQALIDTAKKERDVVKKTVIEPAYNAAFKEAGDAKIDVSNVVSKAESILERKLSDFAPESAPSTVRKLMSLQPKVAEVEAETIGKAGFKAAKPAKPELKVPSATLQQLDDIRKAINADIAAAKSSPAGMADTTLRNLNQLHAEIDAAVAQSKTLPDAAKTAYSDALSKYREVYAPRFKTGVNANLFKQTSLNEPKINPDDVVTKFFSKDGEREAGQFVDMFGKNADAMKIARAGIEDLYRRQVTDAAGNVIPAAQAKFVKDYARPLAILDKAGMNLSSRFDVIAQDAQRLAAIQKAAEASGNKLSPPLPPGSNALAVEKKISELTKNFTPDQLKAVDAVKNDIAREMEYARLAEAGGAAKNIATEAGKKIGLPAPSFLNTGITIFNNVVKKLALQMDDKIALELARELTNPALAAKSIEDALKMQATRATTNQMLRSAGRAGTYGATIGANQNALTESP